MLPSAIGVEDARAVLGALRAVGTHRFLIDDVSMVDQDLPRLAGHQQVNDAHLVVLARRHKTRVVTFDGAALVLGGQADVELLSAL